MSRVKFIKDEEPNIKALASDKVIDGAIYVATDTGSMFLGMADGSLLDIGGGTNAGITYALSESGGGGNPATVILTGSDGSETKTDIVNMVEQASVPSDAASTMTSWLPVTCGTGAFDSDSQTFDSTYGEVLTFSDLRYQPSTNTLKVDYLDSALYSQTGVYNSRLRALSWDGIGIEGKSTTRGTLFPLAIPFICSDIESKDKNCYLSFFASGTKAQAAAKQMGLYLTDTTYTAGSGLSLSGTTFSNSGVRSISTGSTAGTLSVNTGGTTSEVKVAGWDSVLPLSGGTMTGNITFQAIGDTAKAAGLSWSGSTDGASIYYQTRAADEGHLVLNMVDDANVTIDFAASGSVKSYIDYNGWFHGYTTSILKQSSQPSNAECMVWIKPSGIASGRPMVYFRSD